MSNSKLLFSPTKIMQSKLYEEGISSLTSVVKKKTNIFLIYKENKNGKWKTEQGFIDNDFTLVCI